MKLIISTTVLTIAMLLSGCATGPAINPTTKKMSPETRAMVFDMVIHNIPVSTFNR